MAEPIKNENQKTKLSPKISFIIGALAGITLTSFIAFIFTFSVLKSAVSDNETNTNNAKVAGAQVNANTAVPSNTNTAPVNTAPPTPVDIKITADDHIRGNKDAKVTLVVYSDYQCPYCSRVETTLSQLLTDYKDKIRLIFRDFPLTSMHANAQKAAEAAECAGDQGKFWEIHDKLFASQSDLSVDNYKAWAKDLGLSTSKFNDCLDSGKYADKVTASITEGSNYGVQGTPATFVNGVLISGAQPIENFKSVIDPLLQ